MTFTVSDRVAGPIDGTGNVVVNAGSDLTANHIVAGALVIGGTAGSPGLIVTISASDVNGNPLDSVAASNSNAAIDATASSPAVGPDAYGQRAGRCNCLDADPDHRFSAATDFCRGQLKSHDSSGSASVVKSMLPIRRT